MSTTVTTSTRRTPRVRRYTTSSLAAAIQGIPPRRGRNAANRRSRAVVSVSGLDAQYSVGTRSGASRAMRTHRPTPAASTTAAYGYASLLADPFSSPPLRLGFGTMCPTELITLYIRTQVAAGADGHAYAILLPANSSADNKSGLFTGNSVGGAALVATCSAFTNQAAAALLVDEARVVAAGIRMFPQIPATSGPGCMYAGSLPSCSYNDFFSSGLTSVALEANPLLTFGAAVTGGTATSRPIDLSSFEMHHTNAQGFKTATDTALDFPVSVPVIIANGLPVGSTSFVEAVIVLEGVRGLTSTAAAGNVNTRTLVERGLADHFGSAESLYRTAAQFLPSPGTVATGASLAAAAFAPRVGSARRLINNVAGRLAPALGF